MQSVEQHVENRHVTADAVKNLSSGVCQLTPPKARLANTAAAALTATMPAQNRQDLTMIIVGYG